MIKKALYEKKFITSISIKMFSIFFIKLILTLKYRYIIL